MNIVARSLLELQETTILAARAVGGVFKKPRYLQELIAQMDVIGVGSLTIIILTGFFTGGVLTVQTFPTLKSYGAQDQTGYLVAVSLVRELGPVMCFTSRAVGSLHLCRIGVDGRLQQIDAMRAPSALIRFASWWRRDFLLVISLLLLTVIADMFGIGGGWVTATFLCIPSGVFINAVRDGTL